MSAALCNIGYHVALANDTITISKCWISCNMISRASTKPLHHVSRVRTGPYFSEQARHIGCLQRKKNSSIIKPQGHREIPPYTHFKSWHVCKAHTVHQNYTSRTHGFFDDPCKPSEKVLRWSEGLYTNCNLALCSSRRWSTQPQLLLWIPSDRRWSRKSVAEKLRVRVSEWVWAHPPPHRIRVPYYGWNSNGWMLDT